NTAITASTALSRRSRNSIRCAVSGWFRSFGGRGSVIGGVLVLCWRFLLRVVVARAAQAFLVDAEGFHLLAEFFLHVLVVRLALQFITQVVERRARAATPVADLARNTWQALRAEHQQGDHEDHQQFEEADIEHASVRAQTLCLSCSFCLASLLSSSLSAMRFCWSFSPSFIESLKPFTAPPRSPPILRSFLLPKISMRMTRTIRSCQILMPDNLINLRCCDAVFLPCRTVRSVAPVRPAPAAD